MMATGVIFCIYTFRVLLRKPNLGHWQMKTEFSQTFMVVMTGGTLADSAFTSSVKSEIMI